MSAAMVCLFKNPSRKGGMEIHSREWHRSSGGESFIRCWSSTHAETGEYSSAHIGYCHRLVVSIGMHHQLDPIYILFSCDTSVMCMFPLLRPERGVPEPEDRFRAHG